MTTITEGITRKAEAGTARKAKLRITVQNVVRGTIGLIALCFMTYWFASWVNSPSTQQEVRTQTLRPVQTAQDACDNIYREYHVTVQARPLLKQAGCTMGWNIQSGGLYLIDASGKISGPFYKDSVVGLTAPAIEWRAAEGGAIVKARFYR